MKSAKERNVLLVEEAHELTKRHEKRTTNLSLRFFMFNVLINIIVDADDTSFDTLFMLAWKVL